MDARTPSMSKKKMSSALKGYLILFVMVFISWLVFKLLTPDNFGTMDNMLSTHPDPGARADRMRDMASK